MTTVSLGDMAQSWMLRRQNVTLKDQMSILTDELSKGTTSDVAAHLSGDYGYLSDIERNLRTVGGFETFASEAKGFTAAMQSALENVQSVSSRLSSDFLAADNSVAAARSAMAQNAEQNFTVVVSMLNTTFAGRSLFSGRAMDGPALADAEMMLSSIRDRIAGEATQSGIVAAIDDWFATDFHSTGYQGSLTPLSGFRLGERETVNLDLRADNEALKSVLKNVAVAAIAGDISDPSLQAGLLQHAGLELLGAQDGVTEIRSDLGYVEERIEEMSTRLAVERTSLDYARNELLGIDGFETATKLENVQHQLETLYAVTVRLSNLSLVDFMT